MLNKVDILYKKQSIRFAVLKTYREWQAKIEDCLGTLLKNGEIDVEKFSTEELSSIIFAVIMDELLIDARIEAQIGIRKGKKSEAEKLYNKLSSFLTKAL